MAKKVVATLKKEDSSKGLTKIIKMVKSPKTGAYIFKEAIVPLPEAQNELKKIK